MGSKPSSASSEPIEKVELECVEQGELTVFGEQYVHKGSKNALLHLKSNLFTLKTSTFEIVDKNDNDKVVFQYDYNMLPNIKEKKVIFDAEGNPVFHMKEKMMQMDDKQSIYLANADGSVGEELFKVGGNFGNTKVKTHKLKTNKGKEVELHARMKFFDMTGFIRIGDPKTGTPIARIGDPKELDSDSAARWLREDYLIEIAPGVDVALIVAVVLGYEQLERNQKLKY